MKNKILTAISAIMLFVPDNFTLACLRLGIGIASSGDYDLQLRRLYDFFRCLFYPGLYQRQGEIKTYAGVCRD